MLDKNVAEKIMEFSKIGFGEDEFYEMIGKMEKIMPVIDHIKNGKTKREENAGNAFLYSDLREDLQENFSKVNEILKNAKVTENESFVVPKII